MNTGDRLRPYKVTAARDDEHDKLKAIGGQLDQIFENMPLGVVDLQVIIAERARYVQDLARHHENIEDVYVLRDMSNALRDAIKGLHAAIDLLEPEVSSEIT